LQALQVAANSDFLRVHGLLGASKNKLSKVKFCTSKQILEDFRVKATSSELHAYVVALRRLVPEQESSPLTADAEPEPAAESAGLDVTGFVPALDCEAGVSSQRHDIAPCTFRVTDPSSKWSRRMSHVDSVFLVTSANKDFNLRRTERYLTVAHSLGANPIIVINKADLADKVESLVEKMQEVARGVPVLKASTYGDPGLQEIKDCLVPGRRFAFIGSSGVGKTSITNALLGREAQAVQGIREKDSRGRHTTTTRTSFELANGSIIVDTPGMRAVELDESMEKGLSNAFADLEILAKDCEFRNCRHCSEPGCALRAAECSGVLPPNRLRSYLKLHAEIRKKGAEKANHRR